MAAHKSLRTTANLNIKIILKKFQGSISAVIMTVKNVLCEGCLAGSEEHATLDLVVMSSSPTLGVGIT